MSDAAVPFLNQLRADLRAALLRRDSATVRALRMLIAAIDNAQAVPLDDALVVGARSSIDSECPRKSLRPAELTEVLQSEIRNRLNEAATLKAIGQIDAAAAPIQEAHTFARYLSSDYAIDLDLPLGGDSVG